MDALHKITSLWPDTGMDMDALHKIRSLHFGQIMSVPQLDEGPVQFW